MWTHRRGIALYIDKTKQFTRNAKLVLLYSAFTGLAFGVFRFLFNFYVLSLGKGYNEAFLGTLQTAASFASIATALPAAYLADRFSQKKIMIGTGLLSSLSLPGIGPISPPPFSDRVSHDCRRIHEHTAGSHGALSHGQYL